MSSLSVDPATIERYAGAGPRYTSYPTVPVWSDDVGEAELRAALGRVGDPVSIYVHLPFCGRRCLFCACTVEITSNADRVTRYLDALELEIDRVAAALDGRREVAQLHWGGGTPTHLTPGELRRVHAMLTRHFDVDPRRAEVSIEVHPRVTTDEQLDVLAKLGFNRISLGVQDVDPGVQAIVRRDQSLEDTRRVVERSRANGVRGVNFDLMYGLPGQSEATFRATLDAIADLQPDRLAVYGYAHVPWLKPGQQALERAGLPDARARARLFALAVERLGALDYEVIGLDHFALRDDDLVSGLADGTLHRNFMGYTTQRAADMLAFGMSAIGDVGGTFTQNARSTEEYEAAVAAGGLPVVRGLVRSEDDELRRAVIQSLMCRMVLDLDELESTFRVSGLATRFADEWRRLEPLAAEGFCSISPRRVEVLPAGRLFLRHLAMVFDAYLGPNARERQQFSQTV